MDKQQEAQADSISTVGVQIKADYPPSEVYSSEPPPAYQRPRPTAVQIARIAAVTLIAVSFILGFFMVASAYITATATCYQDYPAPQEQQEDRPVFQALVDPLDTEESSHSKRESADPPSRSHQLHEQQQSDESRDEQPIQVKLPLQLDFDELAGSMIEKNQRSRMNCVVEKRRAEEVMDHQPKTVRLPFGVNLTTDPRYEHITGERMAIFCESGNDQSKFGRAVSNETDSKTPEGDSTALATVISKPATVVKRMTHYWRSASNSINRNNPGQPWMQWSPNYWSSSNYFRNFVPDFSFRSNFGNQMVWMNDFPGMNGMYYYVDNFRHVPMEQEQNVPMMQMQVVPIQVQQIPLHPNAIPHGPHPMHFHHQMPLQSRPAPHVVAPHMNGHMGPNMPPHMVHQVQQPQQVHPLFQAQQVPAELPPQVLQAIQQQITEQRAARQMAEQEQQNNRFPIPQQMIPDSAEHVFIQEEIIPIHPAQAHPRPEGRSMEGHPVLQALEAVEQHPVPSDTVKPPPPPGFTRLPASERPHYVQPRSIRDVSSLLKREKRVRRCACDCAC